MYSAGLIHRKQTAPVECQALGHGLFMAVSPSPSPAALGSRCHHSHFIVTLRRSQRQAEARSQPSAAHVLSLLNILERSAEWERNRE